MIDFARLPSFAAALFIALSFAAPACAQTDGSTADDPTARGAVVAYGGPETVVIDAGDQEAVFTVEIADTAEARARGMMWRESLAPGAGMLFDWGGVSVQAMFMRNTLIPLDLIFIREDGSIAKIVVNAEPRSLRSHASGVPVRAVLEIAGGRSLELGVEPGDVVRHRYFGNAPDQSVVAPGEADPDVSEDGAAAPEDG